MKGENQTKALHIGPKSQSFFLFLYNFYCNTKPQLYIRSKHTVRDYMEMNGSPGSS